MFASEVRRFASIGGLAALLAGVVAEGVIGLLGGQAGETADTLLAPPVRPLPAPPAPPPDVLQRLEEANAQGGDIQVSLAWDNKNDIDLWLETPDGKCVSYMNKELREDGRVVARLDVDRNVHFNTAVNDPVENVYVTEGKARPGTYLAKVCYYRNHNGVELATPCSVHVAMRHVWLGEAKAVTLGPADVGRVQLVGTYVYPPPAQVLLSASPTVEVRPGQSNAVVVNLQRRFCNGPVTLTATAPAGLSASVEVPADQDTASIPITVPSDSPTGTHRLTVTAAIAGCSQSAGVDVLVRPATRRGEGLTSFVSPVVWSGVVGLGISLGLLVAHARGQLLRPWGWRTVPIGLAVAIASGVAGVGGQGVYALGRLTASATSAGSIGFVVGWALLGGLLGWVAGRIVPNSSRWRSILAGAVGGVVVAVAVGLVPPPVASPVVRPVGAMVLGGLVGVAVVAIKRLSRTTWIVVRFREGGEGWETTWNLGPEPILLGSSPYCHVWLGDAAPIEYRFWRDGEAVHCQDRDGRRTAAATGQEFTAGSVTVVVQAAAHPAPVSPPVAHDSPHANRCPHCGFPLAALGRPGTRFCTACQRSS